MARPRATIEDAQKKLDEKFPDKDFTLLEYNGYLKPCVFVCPKHGRQESRFTAVLHHSEQGCPSCAREVSAKIRVTSDVRAKISESHKSTRARRAHFIQSFTTLLQQPLSDEQLGKELRTLLRESCSTMNLNQI